MYYQIPVSNTHYAFTPVRFRTIYFFEHNHSWQKTAKGIATEVLPYSKGPTIIAIPAATYFFFNFLISSCSARMVCAS
jgi:hypothetical protein